MSGGQRLAQLGFAAFQLRSRFLAATAAFIGDAQAILDSGDQGLVRLLHRLNIEYAALNLGARLRVGLPQILGVGG